MLRATLKPGAPSSLSFVRSALSSLTEHWSQMQSQAAPFMHSAPFATSAIRSPAQLQQQQTEQQQTRQQTHPQQQLHTDHIRALQKDPELRRKVMVNRLLYRSRQRGFLEMDLLVGIWAEKQIPQMSEDTLRQFEVVLDQENPDLYKWLTGQEQPPQDVVENAAYQVSQRSIAPSLTENKPSKHQCARMPLCLCCTVTSSFMIPAVHKSASLQALVKDVSIQLRDHVDRTARAPEGKEWVRGWDDWNKASEAPVESGPAADR